MKRAMDFFGEALYAYSKGDRTPFFICYDGKTFPFDLSVYFRKPGHLSRLEKKLVSLANGRILDIGCATGYYFPALLKGGSVEGIDVSGQAVRIARKNGFTCRKANVFRLKTAKRFDTITVLQNGLGMAENIKKTLILLKKLSGLLASKGQILMVNRTTSAKYSSTTRFFCHGSKTSAKFKWINFDEKYLARLCKQSGLKMKVLGRQNDYLLVQVTKDEIWQQAK